MLRTVRSLHHVHEFEYRLRDILRGGNRSVGAHFGLRFQTKNNQNRRGMHGPDSRGLRVHSPVWFNVGGAA